MTNLFAKNPLNRRVATLFIFTATVFCSNITELSQNEFKTIKNHFLKIEFESFRVTIRSRYIKNKNVNLTKIVNQFTFEAFNTNKKIIHEFTRLLIRNKRKKYHI